MRTKTYTKGSLIAELIMIKNLGWIKQKRNTKTLEQLATLLRIY